MNEIHLNTRGRQLQQRLAHYLKISMKSYGHSSQTVHVVGVGGTLSSAYEQLRNAAEYTEEHLLLQRAIKRFFRRVFTLRDKQQLARSGDELVVELTLAGYIPNDTIAASIPQTITADAQHYFAAYTQLEKKRHVHIDQAKAWTLDVLAVETERRFNDHQVDEAFIEFAYQHFEQMIDADAFFGGKASGDYSVMLFVAVWRALLGADDATIRAALLRRYQLHPRDLTSYRKTNARLDEIFASDEVRKLYYRINRRGAPQRILRQVLVRTEKVDEAMKHPKRFERMYAEQVQDEYDRIERRINRAIIKSIVFLVITKMLVGMAIEVPYDMIVYGMVLWLPLIINLLFPPLYMLLLRATLALPGPANTAALIDRGMALLYSQPGSVTLQRAEMSEGRYSNALMAGYGVFACVVFGGVIYGLTQLSFSWLHIIIFFIFLSTASFLGFRLSRMVRDIEVVEADQSGVTLLRDALYLPFVAIGRRLSEAYSQVNIIGLVLDMVIELPLKTILRLIRQWGRFITERQDRL